MKEKLSAEEIQEELDNNAQGILGMSLGGLTKGVFKSTRYKQCRFDGRQSDMSHIQSAHSKLASPRFV